MIRRFVARTGLCVAALATIGGVAACEPAAPSLITDYKTTTTARLTTDGSDAYGSTSTPTGMVTSAPTSNTGANLRMVGFKKESPTSVNQEACATWTEGDAGISQPGVALRIAAAPSRVRAITVTNNILYGARRVFNIHLGDTTAKTNMVPVGSRSFEWAPAPLPWRFCARAEGTHITMKVWPVAGVASIPGWDDPAFTAKASVPPEWVYAGRPGWYVGHLAAGQRLVSSDLAVSALPSSSA